MRRAAQQGVEADEASASDGASQPPGVRRTLTRIRGPARLARARMADMDNRYTGVFEQVGDWWIGYVEELPGCNVQEWTLEEARDSLKEAVQLIVQANRELARRES